MSRSVRPVVIWCPKFRSDGELQSRSNLSLPMPGNHDGIISGEGFENLLLTLFQLGTSTSDRRPMFTSLCP